MLTITVPGKEHFNDEDQTFITIGDVVLELEHSLVSLSKWESNWEKPFLSKQEKTYEETVSYIECMILTPDFDPKIIESFTNENFDQINAYITKGMTATTFAKLPSSRSSGRSETVTSELIYYWMIALGIPFECQEWHLNRLLTLVEVINRKNAPQKKIPKSEAVARQREINRRRRAEAGSKG